MSLFSVIFQLKSYYENEDLNKCAIIENSYEEDSLEALFDMLDEGDEIESIDDTCVINMDTTEDPYEVNVEYVIIKDSNGQELYRDEDYEKCE